MNRPLDPGSWQYRELNSRAPTLSTLSDTLIALAEEAVAEAGLSPLSLACIASIDLKAAEPAVK